MGENYITYVLLGVLILIGLGVLIVVLRAHVCSFHLSRNGSIEVTVEEENTGAPTIQ